METIEMKLEEKTEVKKGFFKSLFKKKESITEGNTENGVMVLSQENAVILFEQIKNIQEEYHTSIELSKRNEDRIKKLEDLLIKSNNMKEDIIDVNVKLIVNPIANEKATGKSLKLYPQGLKALEDIYSWYPEYNKQDILNQIILDAHEKYKPLNEDKKA